MREALSFKLRWPFTVYQLAVTNLSLLDAGIKSGRTRVRDGALAVDLTARGGPHDYSA